MIYRDRAEAGAELAKHLAAYRDQDALVLALPRGGVEVGHQIAQALGADLDVLVVRKLGAPQNPEFGLGAIASYGAKFLDEGAVRALDVPPEALEQVERRERQELARREAAYRGDRPPPRVAGRTVIVVDDGLATGGTAQAALRAVRSLKASRVVLAVPVGPAETVRALEGQADEVVCPQTPRPFQAIGQWYASFDQTADERVIELLGGRRAATGDGC
jgi:predicted phosphoribosyltransferase